MVVNNTEGADTMTGRELLEIARREKPGERYALHKSGNAIAGWNRNLGRWQCVAGLLLDGRWGNLSVELLVNGKPLHEQGDWNE